VPSVRHRPPECAARGARGKGGEVRDRSRSRSREWFGVDRGQRRAENEDDVHESSLHLPISIVSATHRTWDGAAIFPSGPHQMTGPDDAEASWAGRSAGTHPNGFEGSKRSAARQRDGGDGGEVDIGADGGDDQAREVGRTAPELRNRSSPAPPPAARRGGRRPRLLRRPARRRPRCGRLARRLILALRLQGQDVELPKPELGAQKRRDRAGHAPGGTCDENALAWRSQALRIGRNAIPWPR
jgi:hypothetical protein